MIDFQNGSLFKLKKCDNSIADDLMPLFVADEEVIGCYKCVRDHVVFTNKRIIAVNVQGLTGKKKDYTSLPYSKIQVFSIETAGLFDLDSELELYFSGIGKVKFEFSGSCDIIQIGKVIGAFVLR
ncbi:MAG TPA: PH domain-containing protein [Bacillota bacterium]|nr:PH domain-containing protein [Bacillota bacterium]HOK69559.1 PH domain-containing protein [Bacillota bacterium]HPP85953.1 PH domain-containing protein [Bacillota bacterium]